MSVDVIKVKKVDIEAVINTSLNEGLNTIQYQVAKNRCQLDVSYQVVVPSNQKEETIYAFFVIDSIVVEGRGSVKYKAEILEEVKVPIRELAVTEQKISYQHEGNEQCILSGYKVVQDENRNIIYDAVYTIARFVSFENEETVNCTESKYEGDSYLLSTPGNLIRYIIEDSRYNIKEVDVKMLFNNHIYKYNGRLGESNSYTYYLTRDSIRYIQEKEEVFIVDDQQRVWEKVVSFENKNKFTTSFGKLSIIDESLYTKTSLFLHMYDSEEYVRIDNQLYKKETNAVVLFEDQEPIPFMNTNIASDTVIVGKGLYSTIEIDNEKQLIVPITSDFIFSSNNPFTLVVIDDVIHILIGKVSDIGFTRGDYRGVNLFNVTVRPDNEYRSFYESPEEIIKVNHRVNKEPLKLEVYDETFKNKKPRFFINDKVRISKELTAQSKLKGLDGVIVSLSNNKSKASVQFFGHFVETFSIDYLESN